MRKTLAIAGVNLRRLVRDKTAVFFVFVFPFLIILALGATFGASFTPKLGLVSTQSGALGGDLVRRIGAADGLAVKTYATTEDLRTAVERGMIEGGLIIPAGFDAQVRAGSTVPLTYLARPTGSGRDLGLTIESVVDAEGVPVSAARFAVQQGAAATFDEGLARARAAATLVPTVAVSEVTAGTGAAANGFDAGAAQELILFVFLTSLSASSMLIETRRLGCTRRMLASPTPIRTIVAGEALGRYAIAFLQGALIVGGTAVLFRVQWGNPLTTGVIVALFAAAATGAAILMGSVLRNQSQAGAMGVFIGLVFAALGGCMVPLEIFPPVMAMIAHLTPHAWAIEALNASLAQHASLADVGPKLGVLALYAGALLVAATILLRRTLTVRAG